MSPSDSWSHGFPEAQPRSRENVWAVPWSDLMMVMFILFVVLFATKSAEREVDALFRPGAETDAWVTSAVVPSAGGPPEPVVSSLSIFERARRVAAGTSISDVDVIQRPDRSIHLRLGGPLFFASGSAELGLDARSVLDRLALVLAETDRTVRIVGHTDNFPIHGPAYPTNWELSAARAAAVARHLIRRGGSDPARFTIEGRGMHTPAHPNSSPRNKALNRRVEIVITPPPESGSES